MGLDKQRYRKVKDFFHKVSFNIVKIAKENEMDTIVIGKNDHWKQEINLGKKNNQNFVQIPHSLLIELITIQSKRRRHCSHSNRRKLYIKSKLPR